MRIYIIVLFVALLLLLAGCKENEDSEPRQVSELKNQLQQLQSENEKLKKECHQIRKEYEQLKKVYNLRDDVLRSPERKKSSGIYDEVFQ